MLQIPEVVKNLFQIDGIRKNTRVTFPNGEFRDLTNKDIIQGSVRFTESLCSRTDLKLGLCESSIFEFTCVGIGNIKNVKIQAQVEIDCSSLGAEWCAENAQTSADVEYPFYVIPYGVFWVDTCKKQSGNKNTRTIVSYTRQATEKWERSNFEQWKQELPVASSGAYQITFPAYMAQVLDDSDGTIWSDSWSIVPQGTNQTRTNIGSILFDNPNKKYIASLGSNTSTLLNDYVTGEIDLPMTVSFSENTTLKAYQVNLDSTVKYKLTYPSLECEFYCGDIRVELPSNEVVRVKHHELTDEHIAEICDAIKDGIRQEGAKKAGSITSVSRLMFQTTDLGMGGAGVWVGDVLAQKLLDGIKNSSALLSYEKNRPYAPPVIINSLANKVRFNYNTITEHAFGDQFAFFEDAIENMLQSSAFKSQRGSDLFNLILRLGDRIQIYTTSSNKKYDFSTEEKLILIAPYVGYLIKNGYIQFKWRNGLTPVENTSSILIDFEMDYPIQEQEVFIRRQDGSSGYYIIKIENNMMEYYARVTPANAAGTISNGMYQNNGTYGTDKLPLFHSFESNPIYYDDLIHEFEKHTVEAYINYSIPRLQIGNTKTYNVSALPNDLKSAQEISQSYIELMGLLGKFNRYGKFEYISINGGLGVYPRENLYPNETLYPQEPGTVLTTSAYMNAEWEDEYSKPYDRILANFKTAAGETIAAYLDLVDHDVESYNPDAYQTYDISNNFFIKNKTFTVDEITRILNEIAKNIGGIRYMPSEVLMRGLPYLEAGDYVEFLTEDGGFQTIILRNTINGEIYLSQSIVSN